jgi:hypothetical protein
MKTSPENCGQYNIPDIPENTTQERESAYNAGGLGQCFLFRHMISTPKYLQNFTWPG